jgi:hypothetical protein
MAKWKEPLQLKAGKCYIDEDGDKVGPLRHCGDCFDVADKGPQCELLYQDDGVGLGNPDLVSEWVDDDDDDDPDPYFELGRVLGLAFEQASGGKGAQRHGQGKPFDRQPMLEISRMLNGSPIGCMYQAIKKTQEASRMDTAAAQRELLGAINYLAGAYLLLEESSST